MTTDEQVFEVIESMPGENFPPMHPRCRCTIVPSLGEQYGKRTSKIEGKRVKIPQSMTFNEWKKVYVDNPSPRGLGAGNKVSFGKENVPPHILGTIPNFTPEIAKATLEYFEPYIAQSAIENAIIVMSNGEVWHCAGDLNGIPLKYFDSIKENLEGAEMTHNHPKGSDNEYTFSNDDISFFKKYKLARLRGIDEKFVYEMDYDLSNVDEIRDLLAEEQNLTSTEYEGHHKAVIIRALNEKFGYRRRFR